MRSWSDARCCARGCRTPPIILKTETPLTKTEAIQALQAVLALNGISVVNIGDKFVKVLPVDQAARPAASFNDAAASQLPDLGTYVTRIVQLKYIKPSEMVPHHPAVRKTAECHPAD